MLSEIATIFRNEFGQPDLIVHYGSSPKTIEKWDSVNNLVIISAIEERFKIEFSIDSIFKSENVGDLCDYVVSNTLIFDK